MNREGDYRPGDTHTLAHTHWHTHTLAHTHTHTHQAEFGAAMYIHTLDDVQFKGELDFEKNTARVSVCE